MRKLLIVSPHFPPKNGADLHRVRTSLPHYQDGGWEPTILYVSPQTSEGVDDPLLAESLPVRIKSCATDAWPETCCRRFGFGQLAYRSIVPLYRAGTALLKHERYDVVFFSSTVFLSFILGPIWKRRFGCKIVYDFQDPWFEGGNTPYTPQSVPGSWHKYRIDQWLAGHFERFALKSADHIISVSEGYIRALSARYPWLGPSKFSLMPFGAAKADYDFVLSKKISQPIFVPDDGIIKWVSVGRAGIDMDAVLRIFFGRLAKLRRDDPAFAAKLRVYFVGTNYASAPRSTKLVEHLADEMGVSDMVIEHAQRIPYFQAISLYIQSDAVLIFGSASANYTASKLFSCVLSGKPILAMFHADSLVSRVATRFSNIFLSVFRSPQEPQFASDISRGIAWLREPKFDASTIEVEIAPWTAQKLTNMQCRIFDAVAAE